MIIFPVYQLADIPGVFNATFRSRPYLQYLCFGSVQGSSSNWLNAFVDINVAKYQILLS